MKKGPEILIGTPGRVFELVKHKKIKMMNVDTIILDEFDELLSDSQYHFVENIIHRVPRDHQMIYMSATDKVDPEVLAENTLTIGFLIKNLIKSFTTTSLLINVIALTYFANSQIFQNFVAWFSSTAYLI